MVNTDQLQAIIIITMTLIDCGVSVSFEYIASYFKPEFKKEPKNNRIVAAHVFHCAFENLVLIMPFKYILYCYY